MEKLHQANTNQTKLTWLHEVPSGFLSQKRELLYNKRIYSPRTSNFFSIFSVMNNRTFNYIEKM